MKFRRSRLFPIVSVAGLLITAIAMVIAPLVTSVAKATSQGISSQTTQINAFTNTPEVQITDTFQVSGYTGEANLLVTISITGETQATFSLPTTTGLTLEYGYGSWVGVSTIAFAGTQADINSALSTMSISAGQATGTSTLNVSVQEKVSGANYFDGTGHLYEFVPNWDITYMEARTAAAGKTLNGLSGYLVTVTSQGEHNFVLTKIKDAQNIWIALSDRENEGTWVLDPKDGHPEQGDVVWTGLWNGTVESGQYAAWCGGEPNDAGGEDAAVTLWYGGNCWNDLPHDTYPSVGGYVVEYEPTQIANPIYSDSIEINISLLPPPTFSGGGCGPYQKITVTGNTNGPVWGSNPYTDDSNFAAAAVHAGLISVGQTATIEPYWVDKYPHYGASIANGITTSEWDSDWCGYYIKLAGSPTPTTTTTTTTTTVPPTTTTTSTTTTTVYVPTVTTTTEVPETTTTTTTTVVQTTTTTEVPETTSPTTTVPDETESTVPDDSEGPSTTTSTTEVPQSPNEEEETPRTTNPSNPTVQPEDRNPPVDETQEAAQTQQPESKDQTAGTEETTQTNDTDDATAGIVVEVISEILGDKNVSELTDDDKSAIAAAVVLVIENGVSKEVSTELSSEPAVLASINTDQAEAIFETLPTSELTAEQAAAVVDAVQTAPDAIREVFEEAVDLFQGAFDNYQMLGQTITVGERRTVVAVAALTTAIAATQAAGAMGGMPSGGSPQPSPASGTNDTARREEEEEASGEIAGDGVEWIHNIKIFKYIGGVRVLDKKAFSKKFVYGVMNLGFTLAGSLVVYLTLSGPIQVIAGISTVVAFGAAMWLHMKEPE